MTTSLDGLPFASRFPPGVLERALNARDPRFDGLFFVGITTTGIYCRPVCPARVSYTNRRRFFPSAAAAERAGFRPCLRCRPELAPGRGGSPVDAVSRLARTAAQRIAAGGLNGRSVARLAAELGVSERHLRRALERELGVSPLELAQTHRLLLAKQLLSDTALSITRIAFTSGFQSLRRFNASFRERYRLSPGGLRRHGRKRSAGDDEVRLTLGYRPPLDWPFLTRNLTAAPLPGVELLAGDRYLRTVKLQGQAGIVSAEPAGGGRHQLRVTVSLSLLGVLMPLLPRLRQLFDLDAEPVVVESQLADAGELERLLRARPGLRLPGAFDGFEAVLRTIFLEARLPPQVAGRVIEALGERADTGRPGLDRYLPGPDRIARAGSGRLAELGVPAPWSGLLTTLAARLEEGTLRLAAGSDPESVRRELLALEAVNDAVASGIVLRALHWPDAFAATPSLVLAAGVSNGLRLHSLAERWRPWRAYAALYLSLGSEEAEQAGMAAAGGPRRRSRPGLDVRQRGLGAAG